MECIKRENECCFCSSKEDLFSLLEPHNYGEKCEIYSTMIAECFQIELNSNIHEYNINLYVICKNCVFRLRDAIIFRSQIQIAYDRLSQELAECFKNDKYVEIPPVYSDNTETEKIIPNPDMSDLAKYCKMEKNEIPIECSDILETEENVLNLGISECMNVDSAASYSNEDVLRLKPSKDNNQTADITIVPPEECFKTLKTTNSGDDAKSQRTDAFHNNMKTRTDVKNFNCGICRKSFASETALRRHTRFIHESINCDYCNKSFNDRRKLRRHAKSHLNKDLVCNICGKTLRRKQTFENHILLHSEVKSHKCEFCEKVFASRSLLLAHTKIHSNPQKFTCRYCNKTLASTTSVLRHEKIHLNIKDFICDFCNREFRLKDHLKDHILLHMDGKNNRVKCDLCDKHFLSKETLFIHIKSNH